MGRSGSLRLGEGEGTGGVDCRRRVALRVVRFVGEMMVVEVV